MSVCACVGGGGGEGYDMRNCMDLIPFYFF